MADPRLLLVEDDSGTVDAFVAMLRIHGYGVHVAASAEAALEYLSRCTPAAMVLDLHLPVLDGLEFLRRVRACGTCTAIPAAMVTGDYLIDSGQVAELRALNARVFFKPLWEDDLLALVELLLAARGAPVETCGAESKKEAR